MDVALFPVMQKHIYGMVKARALIKTFPLQKKLVFMSSKYKRAY